MILISEVAWMGSTVDESDDPNAEWLELMNSGGTDLDLTGWTLKSTDGSPNVTISDACTNTIIQAGGFYLLARGADNAYGVSADCTYPGGVGVNQLENGGEDLELRNADGDLKDNLPAATGGWPGGDNSTNETLQRTSSETWGTFAPTPGGPAPMP